MGPSDLQNRDADDPLQAIARLLQDALKLSIDAVGGRVEIALPDGETALILGTIPRPNGPTRFYIGALLPPNGSVPASRLSRAFGGGSVVRIGGRKELHQLSPYGPADMARTPEQATGWFIAKITAAWDAADEQSGAVTRKEPPATPESPDEVAALRQTISDLEAETATLRAQLARQSESISNVDSSNQLAELHAENSALEAERARLRAQLSGQSETSERVAELIAENAALRRDRDEIRQLLEVAGKETTELEEALRESQSLEQMATRSAGESEAELVRAWDELRDAQQQVAAQPATGMTSHELSDAIVGMLDLVLHLQPPSPATVALLERASALVQGDLRVAGVLAEHYVRVDRPHDAILILGPLDPESLSPVTAAFLVEAYLQRREVPPNDVLERADWNSSHAAALLDTASTWLSPDAALQMSSALVSNPPTGADGWLRDLSRRLADSHLEALYPSWVRHDRDSAARALVQWIDGARVSKEYPWVVEALRDALDVEDRTDAVKAFEHLIDVARRREDRELLEYISRSAQQRLSHQDRLRVGVAAARVATEMPDREGPTEQDALSLIDLYLQARPEADEGIVHEIRELAKRMHVKADPKVQQLLAPYLRQVNESPGLDSIAAVSTVADALDVVALTCRGLLVLEEARESAEQRGSLGYKKALTSLKALGRLADRFAAGDLGESVQQACRRLPGHKEDISDSAKQEFGKDYERRLPDGRTIRLGPHIHGGAKDGRIYFYIDEVGMRIVVGHVGKHLPGSGDT